MGAVGTCVEVRVGCAGCGLNADNGKTGFDLQEEQNQGFMIENLSLALSLHFTLGESS